MSDSNQPPPTLNYSPADHSRRRRLIGQAIGGAIITVVLLSLGIAVAIVFGVNSAVPGIVFGGVLLGATVLIGVGTSFSPKYHGWGIGIWIGLGITILLEGTCFIAIR